MTNLSRICRAKIFRFYKKIYPRATSRTIISVNPIATPIVPMLECLPFCDSGISSSVTTYIIAPAANERRYGNNGTAIPAKITVSTAPMGSTTPDIIPRKHDFLRDAPPAWSGSEIIAPSGKFCIAIPTARANAPATVIPVLSEIAPTNVTPTAIPSGILCKVTARTSIVFFERLE